MIHSQLLQDQGILVITPDGPLETADFERLAKEVDPFIASNGQLAGLMIYTEQFPGWESFGALMSHLRFVSDHHQQIKRVAAVTNSGVLSIAPRIANHFVRAEVRHFDYNEKDRALAWLEKGQ
jgi:hypothetical protein